MEENEENNPIKFIKKDILTYVGFISTLFFYASPCVLIYNLIYEKIKLEFTSSLVMLIGLIHTLLWFLYGFIFQNNLEIWCNFMGCILCFIWLVIYLYFYSGKEIGRYSLYIFALTDLIFIIGLLEYDFLNKAHIKDDIKDKGLRWFATVFNVIQYFTPGLNFVKLYKTRNFRFINHIVAIFGAIQSFFWLLIGIGGEGTDKWIDHPYYEKITANSIGFVLSGIQVLYWYRHRHDKMEIDEIKYEKDVNAHLVLAENKKEGRELGKKNKKTPEIDSTMFEFL